MLLLQEMNWRRAMDKDQKIKELEKRIEEMERSQRQRVPFLPPEPIYPQIPPRPTPWDLPGYPYRPPLYWC